MRRTTKKLTIGVSAVCAGAAALMLMAFMLFHGYFDRGRFTVERTERSSSGQVASIARRSDNQAMDGDQLFVVLGDHPLSPAELRRAYYNEGLIFRAGGDCLTLRWESSHHLVVACNNHTIKSDEIAVQEYQQGETVISYQDIPEKN